MPFDIDFRSFDPWLIVALLAAIAIVWFLLFRIITKVFEKWVMKYFDWCWKPTPEDFPEHIIIPEKGVVLEKVLQPLKQAIVWWYVAQTIVKIFIGRWLIVGGLLIGFLYISIWPAAKRLFFPNTVEFSISSLQGLIPILYLGSAFLTAAVYWYWSWWRMYRKTVACTDFTYFIEVKPVLLALFPLYRACDPRVSKEPTHLVKEVRMAPDVEDVGGEKTPWLRDVLTKWLSRRYGMSSMVFYSERIGALDYFPWVPRAHGEEKCLEKIRQKSADRLEDYKLFYEDAHKARTGAGADREGWDKASALGEEEKVWVQFSQLYPTTGEEFFLFDAEEPDRWNPITGEPATDELSQTEREQIPEPSNPRPTELTTPRNSANSAQGAWDLFRVADEPSTTAATEAIRSEAKERFETFNNLWILLYRKRKRVEDALGKVKAFALFIEYDFSLPELAHSLGKGKTGEQILLEYPISEKYLQIAEEVISEYEEGEKDE